MLTADTASPTVYSVTGFSEVHVVLGNRGAAFGAEAAALARYRRRGIRKDPLDPSLDVAGAV